MAGQHFTKREIDILACIATGSGNKQVACSLGITERTVKTHLERLYDRLGLHSRSEAVALWAAARISDPSLH